MSARSLVAPLALLAATLMASSALAITPITDSQQRIRNEIAQQLAPQKSYALVIGISEFDNPDWPDLEGVPDEVASVRREDRQPGGRHRPEPVFSSGLDLVCTLRAERRVAGRRVEELINRRHADLSRR